MKMNLSGILVEFRNYLIQNGISSDTCYAYDYSKKAIEQLLIPYFNSEGIEDPFCSFNQSSSNSIYRSLIIAISECVITNELGQLSLGKSAKTIINWRSGLRKFFAFLENDGYCFQITATKACLNHALTALGGTVSYSKKDLQNVFWSRIITQDRAYNNMLYPARLINLIFNNSKRKNDYKKLLKDAINKTRFIYDVNGNYYSLDNITAVTIDYSKSGGNVQIEATKKLYDLYTEIPKKSMYDRIHANGLDDLSLDHKTPLQQILDTPSAKTDYPKLSELSEIYANFVNGSNVVGGYLKIKDISNFKKHSPACYKNGNYFNDNFADDLYNDLVKLYNKIQLVIMLKKYNSSKGNRP